MWGTMHLTFDTKVKWYMAYVLPILLFSRSTCGKLKGAGLTYIGWQGVRAGGGYVSGVLVVN
jgi:hypothetical protein